MLPFGLGSLDLGTAHARVSETVGQSDGCFARAGWGSEISLRTPPPYRSWPRNLLGFWMAFCRRIVPNPMAWRLPLGPASSIGSAKLSQNLNPRRCTSRLSPRDPCSLGPACGPVILGPRRNTDARHAGFAFGANRLRGPRWAAFPLSCAGPGLDRGGNVGNVTARLLEICLVPRNGKGGL